MSSPIRSVPARALAGLGWLGLILAGCQAREAGEAPGSAAAQDRPQSATPDAPRPTAAAAFKGDRLANLGPAPTRPAAPQEPSPFRFAEITKEAGIDFVHVSGMTEEKHFPTANGSGVAIFDYDGDGRLDLYFASNNPLSPGEARTGSNRLFRNRGDGRFEDQTEASGLGFRGFCHGIVVGDLDNDGDPDVFLCNYGPNALFLNRGDGTFEDISKAAGIDVPAWSSGGALLDYDDDGDLDVYVANYGDWKLPDDDMFCGNRATQLRIYCSPRFVRTTKHFLYRNNGDRTFTEVSESVGIVRTDGRGFAAVTADLNGDGKTDIYVANDVCPNFLYLNNGDGTFSDATETSGAAYDVRGTAQSGMGVDAEDIDGDGRPELFVTNFQNEYNTLYRNLGEGTFLDETAFVGLAADSYPWVGWGCALADFDGDGWPDAFVANGHVDNNRGPDGQPLWYEEPPLLHRNIPLANAPAGPPGQESRRFRLSTRDVGPYFASNHVARGAAFGDLDDDGDLDIVVNHKDGPPAVLRNDTPTANRWIRLRLVGTRSNRDAVGARVEVEAGGRTIHRQRKGAYSLQSSNDPRLLIGLGGADEVTRLTVRWPSGAVTVREGLATGASYEIVEEREEPGT